MIMESNQQIRCSQRVFIREIRPTTEDLLNLNFTFVVPFGKAITFNLFQISPFTRGILRSEKINKTMFLFDSFLSMFFT